MLLAAAIYGPALATLAEEPSLATGVYMLSVGGTFFAVNNFARTNESPTIQGFSVLSASPLKI